MQLTACPPIQISVAFATTLDTPEHVALPEQLVLYYFVRQHISEHRKRRYSGPMRITKWRAGFSRFVGTYAPD
jgi:hypothetical protein